LKYFFSIIGFLFFIEIYFKLFLFTPEIPGPGGRSPEQKAGVSGGDPPGCRDAALPKALSQVGRPTLQKGQSQR
jgi:hypothetical protein